MKLPLTCMQCFHEQGQPSFETMLVELTDDVLMESTCSAGHQTYTALQEQKHELLFDLAVMAWHDGYPREAATGFAAALERFYEFATRVISTKQGVSPAVFHEAYKPMGKLSERQLGGFFIAYMLETKSAPPNILNKKPVKTDDQSWQPKEWKEFRNSVVHNGYLPSLQEALAYGAMVYDHIVQLTKWLVQSCPDAMQTVTFERLAELHKLQIGKLVSTMSSPRILSPNKEGFGTLSFLDAVSQVKEYKERIYHS